MISKRMTGIGRTRKGFDRVDCEDLFDGRYYEPGMNTNVFTSSYVFISSLGLTPYYIIEFLIVKRGGVDVSIINGSQGSLTLYEHEPFS